jgi:phosphotransferase system  glucose/maltose/N-acetylglucosamine-specific IIC component
MIPIIDGVLDIGGKLIDKELETRMSAILAEANSKDPWTSRARPSFMYVIYVCILAGIPMGVLHAFYPAIAVGVAEGFKAWLQAIPDTLYTLFGVGYVGYSAARTVDKRRAK